MTDIGFSSFDIFFLVSEIEKNFNIQIEMKDDFSQITTLKELYQFIIKQIIEFEVQKDDNNYE